MVQVALLTKTKRRFSQAVGSVICTSNNLLMGIGLGGDYISGTNGC